MFLGASYYIGNLRVYQTEGRLLFLAVRHDDIYRANVQEKLKQLEVTAVVPGADVGADITIMMELLPEINGKFGLSPEQIDQLDSEIKGKILVIITSIGSKLVGQVMKKEVVMTLLKKIDTRVAAKQVVKYIPFIGQAVSASISFGAMKYLGNSHIDECYEVSRRVIEMQDN